MQPHVRAIELDMSSHNDRLRRKAAMNTDGVAVGRRWSKLTIKHDWWFVKKGRFVQTYSTLLPGAHQHGAFCAQSGSSSAVAKPHNSSAQKTLGQGIKKANVPPGSFAQLVHTPQSTVNRVPDTSGTPARVRCFPDAAWGLIARQRVFVKLVRACSEARNHRNTLA